MQHTQPIMYFRQLYVQKAYNLPLAASDFFVQISPLVHQGDWLLSTSYGLRESEDLCTELRVQGLYISSSSSFQERLRLQ